MFDGAITEIKINEHTDTNIFAIAIIYFTNEHDHIFLFWCLHSHLATLKVIKNIQNEINLNYRIGIYLVKAIHIQKNIEKITNQNDIFCC